MKPARSRKTRQRGMVVGLLIALLLLGGALFAFTTLNVASVRVDRDRDTNEVLAQAKDALVAYAVTDLTRPGQLPCPDVNNDGEAKSGEDFNAATGACISLVGRLPWVTLRLPDLRDDTGERLWYAVSADFRTDNTIPPAVPLNSDTAYRVGNASLTLAGITPASNLAAVVFAPGQTLLRSDGVSQARGCIVGTNCDANLKCTSSPASATPKCNPQNFLDLTSGVDNADANPSFVSATLNNSFNDRSLPIFSDDIMRLVERRAARELAQHLRNHYDAWQTAPDVGGNKGFYPYAVPLVDPSAPAQAGSNGNTAGLLPFSTAPLTWSNYPPLVGVHGCWTENGGTVLRCRLPVTCIVVICLLTTPLNARIENVATRFVDPPQLGPGSIVFHGLNLGGNASWTLNAAARRLEFDFGGLMIAAGLLDLEIPAPPTSAWLATSWLTANNWNQSAGYALSSGYAIDGGDTCGGAGPSCLTIANTTAPNNNKQAIVIMAGRALPAAGQSARPVTAPASIGDFVEGLNADGNVAQFENNARTATFNDTPIAVRP